jgi:hypothetical protein
LTERPPRGGLSEILPTKNKLIGIVQVRTNAFAKTLIFGEKRFAKLQ